MRIGDDAAGEVRRAHFAAAKDAISAAGGKRVKSVGDGIMAVFSSVGAAIDCAVWIQQSIEELRRRYGPGVPGVRIGVSHGEATSEEDDWYGIPVVEAARLCAEADGGQILVPDVVRAIAAHRGRHSFRPLGVLDLKGLREPLEAHEIVWEPTAARPPFPAGLGTAPGSLFVGRDTELGDMRALWRDASARRPRLVLLAGDPGIGKTRMAAELAREAYLSGAIVIFGRSDEETTTPYQPFAEALRAYVEATDHDELRSLTGARELPRMVPEITSRIADLPDPTKADAESERYLLFEAVTELLAHASTRAPVLLVLDDLQWATTPTWLLLRHVLRSSKPTRLMFVGTYRGAELTREAADIVTALRPEAVMERLSLRGLDREAVAEFLRAVDDQELDERATELASAVHHETEGNPFFLSEMLAHLVESGVIYQQSGRWTASPDVDVRRLDLPAGIAEVVSRRLARLSELSNRALVVASVVGPEFSLKLLESIPEAGEATHLLDAVEDAVSAGLVRDEGVGRFAFAHALVRQVVYSALTSSRRMQLHLRVAEALERDPGAEAHAEALAYHFAEAAPYGPVEKAVDYALAAGRRSLERLAFEEALVMLERGLAVLDLQQPVDEARRAALALELSEASWHSGNDIARNQYAVQAAEAANACGRADMLGRAATLYFGMVVPGQPDPQGVQLCEDALAMLTEGDHLALRARVLSALAHYRIFGEVRGAAAAVMAEEAVETARRSGDADAIAHALVVRSYSLWGSPDVALGPALLDESLRRAGETGNLFRVLGAHAARARFRLELGDIKGFSEDRTRELELAETGFKEYWASGMITTKVLFACMSGRFAEADRALADWDFTPTSAMDLDIYAGHLFVVRREQGRMDEMHPLVLAAVARRPGVMALRAYLAYCLAEIGDLDGARAELDEIAADGFSRLTHDITFTTSLAALAQTCSIVGAMEHAGPMYELLLPHEGHLTVAATADVCVGSIDRHLGILAATLQRWDTAEAHYRSALQLEERVASPPFLARTQMWYAKMLLGRGGAEDRTTAQEQLRLSLQTASELGMAAVASEVRSLLATVSV